MKLKLLAEIVPVFADYGEQYAIENVLFPYTPRFIEKTLIRLAVDAGI